MIQTLGGTACAFQPAALEVAYPHIRDVQLRAPDQDTLHPVVSASPHVGQVPALAGSGVLCPVAPWSVTPSAM